MAMASFAAADARVCSTQYANISTSVANTTVANETRRMISGESVVREATKSTDGKIVTRVNSPDTRMKAFFWSDADGNWELRCLQYCKRHAWEEITRHIDYGCEQTGSARTAALRAMADPFMAYSVTDTMSLVSGRKKQFTSTALSS